MIGEVFSSTDNWLDSFNEPDNFIETSSYVDFIPFNIRLCLSELYKGVNKKKVTDKFVVEQCYYHVISNYFPLLLNNVLRNSIEGNIIAQIPKEFIKAVFTFSLNEKYAIRFDEFCKRNFRIVNNSEREILNRLRIF